MKSLFTTTFLFAMIVLMLMPGLSYSQSGTLTVYANGKTLDQVIAADTVTGGMQKHSIYQLVSLDSTYLLDATVTIKSDVSIIGVPDGTTGRLPCIQSDVLSDQTVTGIQFTFTGQGTNVVFKNVYLLGVSPDNTVNTAAGQGVQISADSVSLTVDNCVFDDFTQFCIGYNGNWDKFKITNTKFRNGIELASAYYVPESIRYEWPGLGPTDSVIVKYNTFLCVAEGPVIANSYIKYFEFSHNTMVQGAKAPVWTEALTTAKIDNNIFYNTYAISTNPAEYYGKWDEKGALPRKPAVMNFIPLDSAIASAYMGKPITNSTDSVAAEKARTIEVKNNAYFWSSELTTFYQTWNDTATVDSIYPPVYMNPETEAMFGSADYPNFTQSGNQNADPGFGAGIGNVLGSTTAGDGDGLLGWIAAVRSGKGSTEYFAYQRTDGTAAVPVWPLPESNDLKYSNTALQNSSTDGKPLGDPYWFTGEPTAVKKVPAAAPDKFTLNNNYPNPFNPSTIISFNLAKEGNVSLSVYNVVGQLVKTVVDNAYMNRGEHQYMVNMDNFATGVYFYTLRQGSNVITKKMVLLK